MGQLEVVKILIKYGASVDVESTDGRTPLHVAAYHGHVDTVRVLLSSSAAVDKLIPGDNVTSLHLAAQLNHTDVVRALIGAGAEINRPNGFGWTSLSIAKRMGHTELAAVLASGGAVDFEAELVRLKSDGKLESYRTAVPREIDRRCVTMVTELGSGSFGAVWKGVLDESSDGGPPSYLVAIKTSKEAEGTAADELKSEAVLMAQVPPHRNLVGLVGAVTSGTPLLLVLSYCEHGSLLKVLRAARECATPVPARPLQWCLEIARGMLHLVEHHFVHRDLAARNVLLDSVHACIGQN